MSSQDILLLTPGRPALYTTTRALFPVLLPTSPTVGDVCKEFKKTWQFVSDHRFVVREKRKQTWAGDAFKNGSRRCSRLGGRESAAAAADSCCFSNAYLHTQCANICFSVGVPDSHGPNPPSAQGSMCARSPSTLVGTAIMPAT